MKEEWLINENKIWLRSGKRLLKNLKITKVEKWKMNIIGRHFSRRYLYGEFFFIVSDDLMKKYWW